MKIDRAVEILKQSKFPKEQAEAIDALLKAVDVHLVGRINELEKELAASACQPHIIGRACEKCGSGDLYIRFRKASDELDTTIGGGEKGRAKTDCLFINCKICDYWWTEET